MRVEDIGRFTELSVERLRRQFRHEDIRAVLPVMAGSAGLRSLLVATESKLAIVTGDAGEDAAWLTRWAPWDAVGFADDDGDVEDAGGIPDADPRMYRLSVLVGGIAFHAQLPGDEGRTALRDFVVAAQASRAEAASRRR